VVLELFDQPKPGVNFNAVWYRLVQELNELLVTWMGACLDFEFGSVVDLALPHLLHFVFEEDFVIVLVDPAVS